MWIGPAPTIARFIAQRLSKTRSLSAAEWTEAATGSMLFERAAVSSGCW